MLKRRQSKIAGALCRSQAGFTMPELLISALLASTVMAAFYSVYRVQIHTVKLQENRLDAQEYARSTLDMIVREIRNAAFNPQGAVSGTALGTGCAGALLPGAPGVLAADATTFTFTADFRGNSVSSPPDGSCDDPDEQITYAYNNCPTGLGDITRNGESLTDCNVKGLDLRYFRQDGTEIARPVTAVDLPNIQRVLVTVTIQSLNGDAQFGGPMVATMTSNADLRNRGLSS